VDQSDRWVPAEANPRDPSSMLSMRYNEIRAVF
jgi:hypothetical protein